MHSVRGDTAINWNTDPRYTRPRAGCKDGPLRGLFQGAGSSTIQFLMRRAPVIMLVAAMCSMSGCDSVAPLCADAPTVKTTSVTTPGVLEPYVGQGDPFERGALEVQGIRFAPCEQGAPAPLYVFAPRQAAHYKVVFFMHALALSPVQYRGFLRHIASHGFVVVAPELAEPTAPLIISTPASVDAELVEQVVEWSSSTLPGHLGSTLDTSGMAISGHSRGGKIAWMLAKSARFPWHGVAVFDPVNSTLFPVGNGESALGGGGLDLPAVVIGAGRTDVCAVGQSRPFFNDTVGAAWYAVATAHAHFDILDAYDGTVCVQAPEPERMMQLAAGLFVSLFRHALFDDPTARQYLEDPAVAPTAITLEVR